MKTYTKLPIEKITTIVDWEEVEIDWPQMFEVVETKEVTTTNKTTRENFVNVIENLNDRKSKLVAEIDAEIAENEAILVEIDKL